MAYVGMRGRSRYTLFQATGTTKGDHDEVNAYIAHMPGVKRAVHAEGKKIQATAKALFAGHDRPGGHSITGEKSPIGGTDWIVSIEGPVPVVIEFGREAFVRESDGRRIGAMQGLHILGRAAVL
jgi:hypothetical protein